LLAHPRRPELLSQHRAADFWRLSGTKAVIMPLSARCHNGACVLSSWMRRRGCTGRNRQEGKASFLAMAGIAKS
jgi:hypothetical protein